MTTPYRTDVHDGIVIYDRLPYRVADDFDFENLRKELDTTDAQLHVILWDAEYDEVINLDRWL